VRTEVTTWEQFLRKQPTKAELWFVFGHALPAYRERAWRALLSRSDLRGEDLLAIFSKDALKDDKELENWRIKAWAALLKRSDFTTPLIRTLLESEGVSGEWMWRIRLQLLARQDSAHADLWSLREAVGDAIWKAQHHDGDWEQESLLKVASDSAPESPKDDPLQNEFRSPETATVASYQFRTDRRVVRVTDARLAHLLRKIDSTLLAYSDLPAGRLRIMMPSLPGDERKIACAKLLAQELVTTDDLICLIEYGSDEERNDIIGLVQNVPTKNVSWESVAGLPGALRSSGLVPEEWQKALYVSLLKRGAFERQDAWGRRGAPEGWNESIVGPACTQILLEQPSEARVLRNVIALGDREAKEEASELLIENPAVTLSDIRLVCKSDAPQASALARDRLISHPQATWQDLADVVRQGDHRALGNDATVPSQSQIDAALARLLRMIGMPAQELGELLKHGSTDWKERDKELLLQFEKKLVLLDAMGCFGVTRSSSYDYWDDE